MHTRRKSRSGRTIRRQIARPLILGYLRSQWARVVVLALLMAVVVVTVIVVGGLDSLYGLIAGIAVSIIVGYAMWAIVEGSDVDHVLVSERGVHAVETKYTPHSFTASSPELQRAVDNVRWKARKIKLLLSGCGRPEVNPVLVVWGQGATALPEELVVVDGVLVSRGGSKGALRGHLEQRSAVLSTESVAAIFDAIEEHTRRTERANEGRTPAKS